MLIVFNNEITVDFLVHLDGSQWRIFCMEQTENDDDDDTEDDDDDDDDDDSIVPILPAALRPPKLFDPTASGMMPANENVILKTETPVISERLLPVEPIVVYHQNMQGVDYALVRLVLPDQVLPALANDAVMRKHLLPKLDVNGRRLIVKYRHPNSLHDLAEASKDEVWDECWGDSALEGRAALRSKEKEIRKQFVQDSGYILSSTDVSLDVQVKTIEKWFIQPKNSQTVNFVLRGPETEETLKDRNLKAIYNYNKAAF